MITSVVNYFFGSTPDDFDQAIDQHPFSPCPDTPNCTIHSIEYPEDGQKLFEAALSGVHQLSPHEIDHKSSTLQIDAVFRIPVFGFKDDVNIIINPVGTNQSILHIKSASRVGKSDLGVNRRRVKRILSAIHKKL